MIHISSVLLCEKAFLRFQKDLATVESLYHRKPDYSPFSFPAFAQYAWKILTDGEKRVYMNDNEWPKENIE